VRAIASDARDTSSDDIGCSARRRHRSTPSSRRNPDVGGVVESEPFADGPTDAAEQPLDLIELGERRRTSPARTALSRCTSANSCVLASIRSRSMRNALEPVVTERAQRGVDAGERDPGLQHVAALGEHGAQDRAQRRDARPVGELAGEHGRGRRCAEPDEADGEPHPEHANRASSTRARSGDAAVDVGHEPIGGEQQRIDLGAGSGSERGERPVLVLAQRRSGLGGEAGDRHHGLAEAPQPRVVAPVERPHPRRCAHRVEAARAHLVGSRQHGDRADRAGTGVGVVAERLEERQVGAVHVPHQVQHGVGLAGFAAGGVARAEERCVRFDTPAVVESRPGVSISVVGEP
jgi:hypothetical protein